MRTHQASRTAVKVGRFMAVLPAGLPEVPVSELEFPVVANKE